MRSDEGKRHGVRSGSYRWYVAAQAASFIGTTMGYAALFWLAIHVAHGRAVALAALTAAQCLPLLLFSRRAATLLASRQPARVLILTQAGQAVGALAIGVPMLAGWTTVWYLGVITFLVGCFQAVDRPARQMFMLELVGPGELRRGTALYSTILGLSKIIGPAVSGVIIAAAGEAWVFVINAASFGFVVVVVSHLAAMSHGHAPAMSDKELSDPGRFRWVLDLPRNVKLAIAMAFLIGGFGYQFEVTNPLMAYKVFHVDSVGFGLFGTMMAIGAVVANYYSSRRGDPKVTEVLAWAGLFGGAELIAAVLPVVWAYDLIMIVLGGITALFTTAAVVYVQQCTPSNQQAYALSAYNVAFVGSVPAGAFLVAAIASTASVRWALIGPGLVLLISAGVSILTRPEAPRAQVPV